MGTVDEWRIYIDGTNYSWDNKNKAGNIKVRGLEIEESSPTTAKRWSATLDLDANSLAIIQGDTVRVDSWSEDTSAWENLLIGEVNSLIADSTDDSLEAGGYCALYKASKKSVYRAAVPTSTPARETFNLYAVSSVALSNANQLVHVPLASCQVRTPLLMIDATDQLNPTTAILNFNIPGLTQKVAQTLFWVGTDWDIDYVVVYVEDFGSNPGWAGSLQLTLRQNTSVPFGGGAPVVIGTIPLNVPPSGPIPDRYLQNRFFLTFPMAPGVNIQSGWAFLELEIVGGAPGLESVTLELQDAPLGAGKLAGSGAGVMWYANYPGLVSVSDTGGNAAKGQTICMEIWSPDTWRDWPIGRIRDYPTLGPGPSFDPADKWYGYTIAEDDLYNSTTVMFARIMLGSIDSTIPNVDVFYNHSFATLTALLTQIYDEWCDDLFDARDISVTNDIEWPDQEAKYTSPLAMLKAVCDRSQCSLESYYHPGTSQTRLRIRDRAEVGDFAGYGASDKALRTLKHGDDDTTARKLYAKLLSCILRKDNFRRRDVVIWDLKQKGGGNADAVIAIEGGATEWDALCAALGRNITIGTGGGASGERNDLDPSAPSDARDIARAETVTREATDTSCRAIVDDLDPVLLANINQAFQITDSRVGLAAEEFLLCGWELSTSPSGGSIKPEFEKDVKWRTPRTVAEPMRTGAAKLKEAVADLGDAVEDETEVPSWYKRELIVVFLNISWAGSPCGTAVSTVDKITLGISNATNNLCAFDNRIAAKYCVRYLEAGRGYILTATFDPEDLGKANYGSDIVEVGLEDVGGTVIYRRAFKAPAVAGWHYNRPVRISAHTKYTVMVIVKD